MKTNGKNELTLTGEITAIRYRSSENWAVFAIFNSEHNTRTNCTGILPDICDIGSFVSITGSEEAGKYGKQIKCSSVLPDAPDTKTDIGVIRILQQLPGIGPAKAKQAVNDLGHDLALRVSQVCPSVLGLNTELQCNKVIKAAKKLVDSSFTQATIFLLSIGLTDHQTAKIIDFYGPDEAVETIKTNPYKLIADINGFGFMTVDTIALKAGISIDSQVRINACLLYCLLDSEMNDGNIWIHGKFLIKLCLDMLDNNAVKAGVPLRNHPVYQDVRQCIAFLESEGKILIDGIKVYSKKLLDCEKKILKVVNNGE